MDGIFGIGGSELIVIGLLAAITLGPERLTCSAREIAKFVKAVKSYFSALSGELKQELDVLDELEKRRRI